MVRLKELQSLKIALENTYFNSKMVRLKVSEPSFFILVEIYFNSKMVRLKEVLQTSETQSSAQFQFQDGTIKSFD